MDILASFGNRFHSSIMNHFGNATASSFILIPFGHSRRKSTTFILNFVDWVEFSHHLLIGHGVIFGADVRQCHICKLHRVGDSVIYLVVSYRIWLIRSVIVCEDHSLHRGDLGLNHLGLITITTFLGTRRSSLVLYHKIGQIASRESTLLIFLYGQESLTIMVA